MSSNTNPLNIEELFIRLDQALYRAHPFASGGKAGLVLQINSYSRMISAHPENIHNSGKSSIPSTEVLKKSIDEAISKASSNASSAHELLVEAYTRIIVGRSQNALDD
jgi:hypothetical protein